MPSSSYDFIWLYSKPQHCTLDASICWAGIGTRGSAWAGVSEFAGCEQAIFRGFLLPSLHRYLPMAGAVLTSSVCFAMAHFSLQRFLPLVFLGIIMGTLYARSNNLLSCITLHSLWNLYIFYQLAVRGGI